MSRLATPELARKHLGNLTALATGRFPVCLTRATTTRMKCALNYETANFLRACFYLCTIQKEKKVHCKERHVPPLGDGAGFHVNP